MRILFIADSLRSWYPIQVHCPAGRETGASLPVRLHYRLSLDIECSGELLSIYQTEADFHRSWLAESLREVRDALSGI